MALISDLKSATDAQFGSALKLFRVARELDDLRRELLARGEQGPAQRLMDSINHLIGEAEELTRTARQSGRGIVDAARSNW